MMEELAHIHLKHKPSQFIRHDGGLACRSYDEKNEREAYWVGAATLVTTYHLNQAKSRNWGQSTWQTYVR